VSWVPISVELFQPLFAGSGRKNGTACFSLVAVADGIYPEGAARRRQSQATALWSIMGAFVWRWAGFNMVIYLCRRSG